MNRWKSFGLILSALVLFQCGDDDSASEDPKDTEKPVVTITTPTPGATVFGTVKIGATAKDNDGVVKMQVFVDNATAAISESATGSIEFDFDTTPFNDGAHTLKIVAVDAAGNSGEAGFTVTIANTLLTFSVPANHISDDKAYWIFLSDEKGALIDVEKLENNATYAYKATKDFVAKSMTMSILQYQQNSPYEDFAYIYSYPNIPYGDYGYTGAYTPAPASKGQSYITISDAPSSDFLTQHKLSYPIGVAFSTATFIGGEGLRMTFNNGFDKSAVMMSRIANNTLTYLYKEITPGSDNTYTTGDFIDGDSKAITVPAANNYTLTVSGSNTFGDFNYLTTRTVTATGSAITAPYPANVFTTYSTWVRMNNADVSYGYYLHGNSIPSAATALNASLSFTVDGATIASEASGTHDVAIFTATYSKPQVLYINWGVYVAGGKQNFVVPALPQVLIDNYDLKNYADLTTPYGYLYDYTEVNGYTDYLAKRLKPATAITPTEYSYLLKAPASTGGRVKDLDAATEERMRKAH